VRPIKKLSPFFGTESQTHKRVSSTTLDVSSSCCGSSSNQSVYLKASGWDGTARSTDSFGITAQSTLVCDITPLACVLKNQLEKPILYQFGIEIMKEILVSNRINGNIERTELIREQIKEYEKEFDNNLKFACKSTNCVVTFAPSSIRKIVCPVVLEWIVIDMI